MGKSLYIAEKPSVAQEFAKALKISGSRRDGYLESEDSVVTWCVGHLVTMSYPERYDPSLKRWNSDMLPFLPQEWKYEIIDSVRKQFDTVSALLNRPDVDTIYVCTDSGREGEYIYRLVEQMAGVTGKQRKRVWIDSQTEEEIRRGIAEAKDLSAYDNLSASAYLRAKEDYLMGINFSRILTLKFGPPISSFMHTRFTVLSVGRVMTCVLGMVVRREREIRHFVKTPFFRVLGDFQLLEHHFEGEWRAVPGSFYENSPLLYKENGFRKKEDAQRLIQALSAVSPLTASVEKIERKRETKNPPLLFNLAELQNECSRRFKISPDETLRITQELYEKKLVTYPRTDARVLSTAVCKEIGKNISGLQGFQPLAGFAQEILADEAWKKIAKTRYCNDKQITDHYAIIPTGQGFGALRSLAPAGLHVYEVIARRFLSIFYPPAIYQKYQLDLSMPGHFPGKETQEERREHFFASFRVMLEEGYLKVAGVSQMKSSGKEDKGEDAEQDVKNDPVFLENLKKLKKGDMIPANRLEIKEGETSPPKRYTSGSLILAMENAGQLIEDEDLRAQMKGSGIGTSATRAEILKKLVTIKYLGLNGKTQIVTPTLLGEIIHDVVDASMRQLLNPELTASWEKGLTYVAEGTITPEEYMQKLERFVTLRTNGVKQIRGVSGIRSRFEEIAPYYGRKNNETGQRTGKTDQRSAEKRAVRAKTGKDIRQSGPERRKSSGKSGESLS
ncbi:DNA topoisomerase [Cuneatibacter caecimuris]|uniref:DNA topoisomerase n=1 Tax=Cuneatibacter caecimuris TaxID=1796618 RepID=A0A4Q7NZY1_9FIRM|nr:DNA topoisomerase [Cuneatibacter caecimuris]RZS92975.1 DNA topoisomerase-3 [Cuneatibacter caecimuris]